MSAECVSLLLLVNTEMNEVRLCFIRNNTHIYNRKLQNVDIKVVTPALQWSPLVFDLQVLFNVKTCQQVTWLSFCSL